MLLKVLQSLVDKGEHGGGDRAQSGCDQVRGLDRGHGSERRRHGGMIVAAGTPEQVVWLKKSYTGRYLKVELARGQAAAV